MLQTFANLEVVFLENAEACPVRIFFQAGLSSSVRERFSPLVCLGPHASQRIALHAEGLAPWPFDIFGCFFLAAAEDDEVPEPCLAVVEVPLEDSVAAAPLFATILTSALCLQLWYSLTQVST